MKKLIILCLSILSVSLILPSYAIPSGNFTMNAGQTTPIITITDSSGNIIWQFNPSPITTVVSKFIKFVNSGLTAVRSYSFPDQNTAIPGLNASKQTFTQYTHFSGSISTPTVNATNMNNNGTITTNNITVTGACVGCSSSSIIINGQAQTTFHNVANTTTQNTFTKEQHATSGLTTNILNSTTLNNNGTTTTNFLTVSNTTTTNALTVSNLGNTVKVFTNQTYGNPCMRNSTNYVSNACGGFNNFATNQTYVIVPNAAVVSGQGFKLYGGNNSAGVLLTLKPYNNFTYITVVATGMAVKKYNF